MGKWGGGKLPVRWGDALEKDRKGIWSDENVPTVWRRWNPAVSGSVASLGSTVEERARDEGKWERWGGNGRVRGGGLMRATASEKTLEKVGWIQEEQGGLLLGTVKAGRTEQGQSLCDTSGHRSTGLLRELKSAFAVLPNTFAWRLYIGPFHTLGAANRGRLTLAHLHKLSSL